MRIGPAIDAAAVGFRDLRIHVRLALQLKRAVGGNVDRELLIEIDAVLVEVVVSPELPRREWRVNDGDRVVLEYFAGAQAGHGNVLHAKVGVNGSFALDGRAEILHGIVSRLHHAAIGLHHADVSNLNALVGGVVAQLNLAPLLHSSLTLHPDTSDRFFAARAVVLKAVAGAELLDYEGFLRIVVLGVCRLGSAGRRCWSDWRGDGFGGLSWSGDACGQGAGHE